MKKKIKLCVIGVGKIFEQYHLPAINSNNNFEIVALVDKNKERLDSLGKRLGIAIYFDVKELRHVDADACFVATPPNVRTRVIKPIIELGMDVICEKPFTYTAKEAIDLIAFADKRYKRIFVTQTRRYFTNMILLREMIANNLAKVKKIRIVEGGLYGWKSVGTERAEIIKNDTGVLHDTGSHLIDSLLFIFGTKLSRIDPKKISTCLFDYEYGANNFKAQLEIEVADQQIPSTIIMSREQNLLDYIELETETGKIKTRSLYANNVEVHTSKNGKISITSNDSTYSVSMDEVFINVWDHIAKEIIHDKKPHNFSFNAKTVLPSIKLIDLFGERKTVKIFNDFYDGEWN